jgi:hypothetical protein
MVRARNSHGAARPVRARMASKAKSEGASRWEVPDAVPRGQVRPHLAAIVRHAKAGNEIFVGASAKAAYSAFVPLNWFERKRIVPIADIDDMDIEKLRGRWSSEREQTENTGRALRILRNEAPSCLFVATDRAVERKVSRTLVNLKKSDTELLRQLHKRVTEIECGIQLLGGMLEKVLSQGTLSDDDRKLLGRLRLKEGADALVSSWRRPAECDLDRIPLD